MPFTGFKIKALKVSTKGRKRKGVGVQANPAGASAIESWLRAVSASDF